jgi:hypothetical protein
VISTLSRSAFETGERAAVPWTRVLEGSLLDRGCARRNRDGCGRGLRRAVGLVERACGIDREPLGRHAVLAELEREGHRQAAGVRSGDQLLGTRLADRALGP